MPDDLQPGSRRLTRRAFLQAGSIGALGLSLSAAASQRHRSCILILNVGGLSHIDSFDPKPDAPSEIRGPFQTIRTNNVDIQVSELFPLHARIADKFSLIRSCYHVAPGALTHDTAMQLVQTGSASIGDQCAPAVGCMATPPGISDSTPAHILLPERLGLTGGNGQHGQDAGPLGQHRAPCVDGDGHVATAFDINAEPERVRERYGKNRLGESCLRARRLVEHGTQFITLNTATTLFNEPTWDIHGFKPFSTFDVMRNCVAPMYDRACSTLISDLAERGLLEETLVVTLTEFGRTPKINAAGGRDHWPHCWTICLAGTGIEAGCVVGKSDHQGAYPVERPVAPYEVLATILAALNIHQSAEARQFLGDARPVSEVLSSRGLRWS